MLTAETGAFLYAIVKKNCPNPANIPISKSNNTSNKLGITKLFTKNNENIHENKEK